MTGARESDVVLAMGEVHTGMLRNSVALPVLECQRLVELVKGEPVFVHMRPIVHVASSRVMTGVDCAIGNSTMGRRVRAVGTVAGHTSITGGHLLQASATTSIASSRWGRRAEWSHYLARPGVLEPIGRYKAEDLANGFLRADPQPALLDLGAISARLLNQVQMSAIIDSRTPLRAARTRLRWVALSGEDAGERNNGMQFTIEEGGTRTLWVRGSGFADVAAFAADLALHDWLLTTLLWLVERSRIGGGDSTNVLARLRPAIDHLLHLWMPAARLSDAGAAMWQTLERRPGLSRQWSTVVDRVRDQLALHAVPVLPEPLQDREA